MMRLKTFSYGMVLLLLVAAQAFATAGDPWIHPGYRARVLLKEISNVANQTYTDFPILVCLSNAAFLSGARADGGDLTFAGVDGMQLFHEIEAFDGTNGNLTAWVCLPSFTNRTRIYLYYSNASGSYSFRGSNAALFIASNFTDMRDGFLVSNTWNDRYDQVYHLSEASGIFRDSTRYANHSVSVDTNIRYQSGGFTGPGVWTTGGRGSEGIRIPSGPGFKNRTNSWSFWFAQGSTNSYPTYTTLLAGPGFNVRITNKAIRRTYYDVYPAAIDLSFTPEWVWHASTLFMGETNLPPVTGITSKTAYFTIGQLAQTRSGSDSRDTGWDPDKPGYFMGTSGTSGAYSGVPIGWADELRISSEIRSTNWLLCEYSNTFWARKGTTYEAPEGAPRHHALPSTDTTNRIVTFKGQPCGAGVPVSSYVLTLLTNGLPFATLPFPDGMTLSTNLAPALGAFSTNTLTWWLTAVTTTGSEISSATNAEVFRFHPRVLLAGYLRDGAGRPLPGALVKYAFPTNGWIVADERGYFNLGPSFSRQPQALRITPRGVQGAELLVTNFLTPDVEGDLVFTIPSLGATNGAERPRHAALFMPGRREPLKVALPGTWDGLGRLQVTLQSIAGGRKMPLWDGSIIPGNRSLEVSMASVQSVLSPGIYLLECRYATPQMDATQEKVLRQLLMVVK